MNFTSYSEYWLGRHDFQVGIHNNPFTDDTYHAKSAWQAGHDDEKEGKPIESEEPEPTKTLDQLGVGILMPDGSVVGADHQLKCSGCKKPLPWSRLDDMGIWAEEFGPMCDSCLNDALANY